MNHMSLLLKEILPEELLREYPELHDVLITRVQLFNAAGRVEVDLQSSSFISCQAYRDIIACLQDALQAEAVVRIAAESQEVSLTEIQKYLDCCVEIHPEYSLLKNATMTFDDNDKQVHFLFTAAEESEKATRYLPELRKFFASVGMPALGFVSEFKDEVTAEIDTVQVRMAPEKPKPEAPRYRSRFHKQKLDDYQAVELREVQQEIRNITFTGKVFAKDDFTVRKTGMIIQSLSVFDGTDALVVKRFEGRNCSKEDLDAVSTGDRVQVYGSVRYDSYAKDLVCEAEEITVLEAEKDIDPAAEKRVELHAHTNMSEMDGVCEAAAVVKYAWNLGHEGIVINDHADVQAFVKAFNQAESLKSKNKERSFKVGLACEMNMVDEQLTIVRNVIDEKIDDAGYVCFDLETTGLSCYYDHIIEFGAVRMKNQTIIDRKQLFIKPPVPIPAAVTNKTNITNDMVRNARPIAEVIDEILDWIGDDVLVAHNATFDYYFLNEELRRMGRPPLTNTVIDTLDLSRAILKDRRYYRLGNISRYYRIAYDEEVAHRADYDAEALSGVFLCLLKDAEKAGAVTIRDLQEKIQADDAFLKVRKSHVTVLAKNHDGLKALYRMVTLSNTDYLAVQGKAGSGEDSEVPAEPRIPRRIIDQYRENLLIGTSCQNNEIFELACNGDDARLEAAMKWYDYVEIQPPGHYGTLVVLGSIPNSERVKEVLLRMIRMAQKLGIPVVADSDAHYCSRDQKMFRDVYIVSQGVGGVSHPLYIRSDELRWRTKNPDQHIWKTQEMLEAFAWLDDPQLIHNVVIDNPLAIFRQLEEIRPVPAGTYPPHIEGSDEKLKEVCYSTARAQYGFNGVLPFQVSDRLDRELNAIIGAGYYVNYYISHLLVKKSNADGYVVGSRGSVGSSFTATMAGITEVNPLAPHYVCPSCHYSEWIEDPEIKSGFDLPDKVCPHCGAVMKGQGHNIPFETFLGFHGDKVPDIDLNFSDEYQAKAHAFTKEVFGEDHVFRAGTIGTVAEKTAFGYVSGYCEKMNITNMRRAMRDYLASGCQNVKRTTGQHPGGIIVIPDRFTAEDFTPVQYPANNPASEWKTTHYDFHDIHDNVLKFDILGHVDPTAMRLLTNISSTDPLTVPLNDPEAISLFSSDDALHVDPRVYHRETGALGLPEFGTRITRSVLEETRPKNFSDLVIISGLTHGTDVWSGNAQDLVRNGHPLEEVIGCRDDIMVYLLNHDLPPKDAFDIMEQVRKGKVAKGQCAKWPAYEEEMREHNVPDWYINSCAKIMYMFPKAHAVAYVMMAVRIAWYKVHEPHNFYIQFLSLRCDAYEIDTMTKGLEAIQDRMQNIQSRLNDRSGNSEPVSNREKALFDTLEVCEELYARGYRISNVDLYRSKATVFTVDENDSHILIPPFTVIDGLGANVARSIEEARCHGEFLSKEDILKRTQLSTSLLRRLEIMGCLNGLQESNQISLFNL